MELLFEERNKPRRIDGAVFRALVDARRDLVGERSIAGVGGTGTEKDADGGHEDRTSGWQGLVETSSNAAAVQSTIGSTRHDGDAA